MEDVDLAAVRGTVIRAHVSFQDVDPFDRRVELGVRREIEPEPVLVVGGAEREPDARDREECRAGNEERFGSPPVGEAAKWDGEEDGHDGECGRDVSDLARPCSEREQTIRGHWSR